METKIWFQKICKRNNLEIDEPKIELIDGYVRNLKEWNQKINLISRKDEHNVWSHHVVGSIAFLFRHQLERPSSLMDLGTGGGLPGIPIAILFPDMQITLIDSIQKKINALNNIISMLDLHNVTAIAGRAEEIAKRTELKHIFDYVISRAVGPMDNVTKWAEPFIKSRVSLTGSIGSECHQKKMIPRGSIIFLKGGNVDAEINQLKIKVKPRSICSYPIVIQGDVQTELADKKTVIIEP
ncbi:MAG: 16S rRNA (guanine(527)-N(7))-methyltransferase RsmG [Ignavibacteria bacterium]|nr:16S rRNA (guanine(527)-N(7))-methyltransferase RsmG [Ignavibacteria bacterium]MBI3765561.1 16S rRNA (guanine(527)-N(7))-methyltransferase RsmG [Ignavibacteriales bacterium]